MNTRKNKTGHPVFIASVLLLLLNDWLLKMAFPGILTGKLSDFAGLFALPFLLGALLPRYSKIVHILAGVLFIIWKSTWSQPFIDSMNGLGIPINRTVDLTDLVALCVLPLSYRALQQDRAWRLSPLLHKAVVLVSALAFTATSLPPGEERKYTDINATYSFPFSKQELVSRLNLVQMNEIGKLRKFTPAVVDFNSKTHVFHYKGSQDTLGLMLDYNTIRDNDTIVFKTSFASVMISGNEFESSLKLLNVYTFARYNSKKDFRALAIRQFERRIVKPIKNYR